MKLNCLPDEGKINMSLHSFYQYCRIYFKEETGEALRVCNWNYKLWKKSLVWFQPVCNFQEPSGLHSRAFSSGPVAHPIGETGKVAANL